MREIAVSIERGNIVHGKVLKSSEKIHIRIVSCIEKMFDILFLKEL